MASPFLKAAAQSLEHTIDAIRLIQRQIQVCMFAAGVRDLEQLRQTPLIQN
jgi:isopentenyl diphosphate isomerase/L-lactate dehydrogenase-like FMN-dependent dehydrogenase